MDLQLLFFPFDLSLGNLNKSLSKRGTNLDILYDLIFHFPTFRNQDHYEANESTAPCKILDEILDETSKKQIASNFV